MKRTLAIFSPAIGVASETFIRRHIEQLHAGRTVVICDSIVDPNKAAWKVSCPVFCTTTRFHWLARCMRERLNRGKLLPGVDPLGLFLKKHNVGVVLAEYMDQSLPIFNALLGQRMRLFVHSHGFDVASAVRKKQLRDNYEVYRSADGIIAVSEVSKKLLEGFGLPQERISVIPCGVDISPSETMSARSQTDKVRCVAVGRMTNKKAPILLLESFRRAQLEYPDLHLDYVGGGELLAAAMQYVDCYSLSGVVTLHGTKDSEFVQQLMRTGDIFLQHSVKDPTNGDMEGLPVAILEAMANALPVVSTRHAGIPEQVMEGETGFLVDELDVGAMAEGIVRLAQSPGLRVSMGAAGYKRAKQYFSWEQNRMKLCAVMGLASE